MSGVNVEAGEAGDLLKDGAEVGTDVVFEAGEGEGGTGVGADDFPCGAADEGGGDGGGDAGGAGDFVGVAEAVGEADEGAEEAGAGRGVFRFCAVADAIHDFFGEFGELGEVGSGFVLGAAEVVAFGGGDGEALVFGELEGFGVGGGVEVDEEDFAELVDETGEVGSCGVELEAEEGDHVFGQEAAGELEGAEFFPVEEVAGEVVGEGDEALGHFADAGEAEELDGVFLVADAVFGFLGEVGGVVDVVEDLDGETGVGEDHDREGLDLDVGVGGGHLEGGGDGFDDGVGPELGELAEDVVFVSSGGALLVLGLGGGE